MKVKPEGLSSLGLERQNSRKGKKKEERKMEERKRLVGICLATLVLTGAVTFFVALILNTQRLTPTPSIDLYILLAILTITCGFVEVRETYYCWLKREKITSLLILLAIWAPCFNYHRTALSINTKTTFLFSYGAGKMGDE